MSRRAVLEEQESVGDFPNKVLVGSLLTAILQTKCLLEELLTVVEQALGYLGCLLTGARAGSSLEREVLRGAWAGELLAPHQPTCTVSGAWHLWGLMNKKIILDCLKTAGHEALTKDLEKLIRPAVFIKGTKLSAAPFDLYGKKAKDRAGIKKYEEALSQLSLGESRFGGLPDLPEGIEWPKRNDIPMEFVAQFRLADVAPFDAEKLLPPQGTLLFFFNSQWDSFDMEDDYDTCRVIYADVADNSLVRTRPPTIEWQGEYAEKPKPTPYLHGLARLTFSQMEMPPGGVSPYITPKSKLGNIWQDFSCKYSNTWSATPRDGNYLENHLLGFVDADDYVGAHKHKKKDQLLLQIDSDDCADFQWGDCDRLYFMLTAEQLAARDFSKVRNYSILG